MPLKKILLRNVENLRVVYINAIKQQRPHVSESAKVIQRGALRSVVMNVWQKLDKVPMEMSSNAGIGIREEWLPLKNSSKRRTTPASKRSRSEKSKFSRYVLIESNQHLSMFLNSQTRSNCTQAPLAPLLATRHFLLHSLHAIPLL